ncbi:GPW/gp25 family protein [Citrobacter arsenatis]|uniref:GPW/gp25 family protein n=1 Tax=Citrobacter arsenatis TaxID=2546350 RepID=UPI00300E2455
MFLKKLSDDNPKELDDNFSASLSKDDLAEEMLMVLTSRPQAYDLDEYKEVFRSVICYGVSDTFPSDMARSERNALLESRIYEALLYFEPRLKDISVKAANELHGCSTFIIDANTACGKVRYYLEWDDLLSHFTLRS